MMKSRILVVDDQPNLSALVRLFLESTLRYEVRVENHSVDAFDAAREFRPDMIVLDVNMPGKDGGEVAREIQEDPILAGVPILFLTSLISDAEGGTGTTMRGGMPYLSKPVNSKILVATVDRMLAAAVPA